MSLAICVHASSLMFCELMSWELIAGAGAGTPLLASGSASAKLVAASVRRVCDEHREHV